MFGNRRNASTAAIPVDIALNTSSVSRRARRSVEFDGAGSVGRSWRQSWSAQQARRRVEQARPNCYSTANETSRRHRAGPSGRTAMLTRRKFIGTTLGAGAALATGVQGALPQGAASARSSMRRSICGRPNAPDWQWVPGMKPQMPEPFTIERALPLMDEAGIARAVIVPPSWPDDRNDYASKRPSDIRTASRSWAAFLCRIRNRPRCCRSGRSSPACSACA